MELPHIGKHCSYASCNKLDFLPIKCDACLGIFCHEHMKYTDHQCLKADERNVQVPVCPICNQPVTLKRGEPPDVAVGDHIDMGCQAANKMKIFVNKCNEKGCKKKELVPIVCSNCKKNFCIRHRSPLEHKCDLSQKRFPEPSRSGGGYEAIQGKLGEDEALARAIALSLGLNNISGSYQQITPSSSTVPNNSSENRPLRSDASCVIS